LLCDWAGTQKRAGRSVLKMQKLDWRHNSSVKLQSKKKGGQGGREKGREGGREGVKEGRKSPVFGEQIWLYFFLNT
jgi:hypothetical protein